MEHGAHDLTMFRVGKRNDQNNTRQAAVDVALCQMFSVAGRATSLSPTLAALSLFSLMMGYVGVRCDSRRVRVLGCYPQAPVIQWKWKYNHHAQRPQAKERNNQNLLHPIKTTPTVVLPPSGWHF